MKSKGAPTFKLTPLYTNFAHSTKLSGYEIETKFDNCNSVLVVEQNNYASKIVNAYIVFDLDTWPKIPLNIFTLKNCLFGATNVVKNNVKEKWIYRCNEIAFEGARSWSFGNAFARNVVIFGVDNSSSSHADNHRNHFLVLGEGDTFGINGSFGVQKKGLLLILVKQRQNFA